MEKNGTAASPATARASSVLPVPGGPTSRTPLGILAPSAWNLPGLARNSLISSSSSTASSTPATSLNVIRGWSRVMRFALALPKFMILELPPCIWFRKKNMTNTSSRMGRTEERIVIQRARLRGSTLYVTPGCCGHELGKRVGAHVGRRERFGRLLGVLGLQGLPVLPGELAVANDVGDLLDPARLDGRDELARRKRLGLPLGALVQLHHDDPDEHGQQHQVEQYGSDVLVHDYPVSSGMKPLRSRV